jgi:glycosyltransferase involved in cell wall biosynthesis
MTEKSPVPRPPLAIIADFPEEGWPSMAICAEKLLQHLATEHGQRIQASGVCPAFRRRASLVPQLAHRKTALNLDRFLNRWWDYPRRLRRRARWFSLFHVCDHSYAHLVNALPAERTGVYCHDLDAFRCLFDAKAEPRPWWFKSLARLILRGFQKAAVIFFSTMGIRNQLCRYGLVDPDRLVHAPFGCSPEYTPEARSAPHSEEQAVLQQLAGRRFLLHVGSCIPRKRIDVLLEVFAGVKKNHPDLLLVQAGGEWTSGQRKQMTYLGIGYAVRQFRGLSRMTLAALYRAASLLLLSSEAEGFGLPVIEALACGTLVVASDLAALREAGGRGAVYCSVADIAAWVQTVDRLLTDPVQAPATTMRLDQARKYSWSNHARIILTAYQKLLV